MTKINYTHSQTPFITNHNQAINEKITSLITSSCITSVFRRLLNYFRGLFSSTSSLEKYYFAYGSNMSQQRLQQRVGNVASLGLAKLDQYRFAFNKRGSDGTGKANIIADANASVEGVVYRITDAQLDKLDRFEGSPKHYVRKNIQVEHPQKGFIQAITYIANPDQTTSHSIKPSQEYLNHILLGAKENNLSPQNCQKIMIAAQQ